MIEIPFIGNDYTSTSPNIDAELSLNGFAVINDPQAKSSLTWRRRSGYTLFATVPQPNRKIYTTSTGRFFSVNGTNLHEIFAGGNTVLRNSGKPLNTLSGPVGIADNGRDLVIVDGVNGYRFNLSSNFFETISDPDFPTSATHIDFQDGYLIANNPISDPQGRFDISGVFDAANWNALDFGVAESSPDILNGLISTGNSLWLFGPDSFEVWRNTGASLFPFQRIDGVQSEIGLGAPYSLDRIDKTVFWLGSNEEGQGIVWMSTSYQPVRISHHALERKFAKFDRIDDAVGYCYQEGGHNFYVLSFPTANETWAYDTTTRFWHRRAFTNFNTNTDNRDLGVSFAQFMGTNYLADYTNGNIYEIDPFQYTDNGNYIKVRRRSPPDKGVDRKYPNSFELDVQTGVGLVEGQGSDPKIWLRTSKDGGHNYGNPRRTTLGKIGKYRTRVRWNRLGVHRDRAYEVTITDPVPFEIIGAYIGEAT